MIIEKLKNDPRVAFVEPDYIITIDTINTNDPYRNLLWGLDNTGQSVNGVVGTTDADIDAPEAWGVSSGSSNTIIGIIDTGVDYNHEDLTANIWTNPGEIANNGIDDDGNGYVDDIHGWNAITNTGNPLDDNGHGTHVAGTIGAVANNGKGIVGINQHVTIIACKFLDKNGSGATSDAVKCFDYFSKLKQTGTNVKVTNNSWGGG
ncbi:MAG: peptidase S8, partial [Candidatus Nitrosotenuis sp.]